VTAPEEFIFAPPPQASVAIEGDARRFPVRRIFCVALNYAAHAREMGKNPDREPPFFFTKPADAIVADGSVIPYPSKTENLHHEVELVAAIGTGGADIDPSRALEHVFGYAVGIDLTRRDLQTAARNLGRPWDFSKGFDRSAPVSSIQPASAIGHPSRGRIELSVNGALKQQGDLADMIWGTPDIIAFLSNYVALAAGDLIFTGTPAGVGPLKPGDEAAGSIAGVGAVALAIAPARRR
jgi:fumarylpyruvate hydrolase